MKLLLLNNIGTPNSPNKSDIKKYLHEFLMDPDIISLPYILRWFLVKGLVVPLRADKVAQKYKDIWTSKGSPLLTTTQSFSSQLQKLLGAGWIVDVGMRYGEPSIQTVLEKYQHIKLDEIYFAPLYPQWSQATTGSAVAEFERGLKRLNFKSPSFYLKPFFSSPHYLESFQTYLKQVKLKGNKILFSYHGLPIQQVKKTSGCTLDQECCIKALEQNKNCYLAHCLETSRLLAKKLELEPQDWSVSFQSRLGPTRWLEPSTLDAVTCAARHQPEYPLMVLSPSFVVDCLETIEELGVENKSQYLREGGKEYHLIPCLNDDERWVKNFVKIIENPSSWSLFGLSNNKNL